MFLESSIFGAEDMKLESALKNPNQFREAVLYETLSNLPSDKKKEFVHSKESKMMLKEGYLTPEILEKLVDECDGKSNCTFKTTVCHMAKENGDPEWDELIKCRIEERRIMNELIEKYGKEALPIASHADTDFVEACIPEYFRK